MRSHWVDGNGDWSRVGSDNGAVVLRAVIPIGVLALGLLAAGCGGTVDGSPPKTAVTPDAAPSSPAFKDQDGCPSPGPAVDMGSAFLDGEPTYATLTAGRYLVRASGFQHGAALDPKVGRTRVVWGPATTVPTYAAGPGTVVNEAGSVRVAEDAPTVATLPAGRVWLLNSNGVQITLQGCAGATITQVSASP